MAKVASDTTALGSANTHESKNCVLAQDRLERSLSLVGPGWRHVFDSSPDSETTAGFRRSDLAKRMINRDCTTRF